MNATFRTTTVLFLLTTRTLPGNPAAMNADFEKLGEQYIDQFAAFSPIHATSVGAGGKYSAEARLLAFWRIATADD